MKNYYEILGVDENASQEEIKKAYRNLAKKHHPDSEDGNSEKFKEINEAHKVLKDKESRKKYDRKMGKSSNGGSFHGEDPFGETFSGSSDSWTQVDFDLGDMSGGRMSMDDIFEEFSKKRSRYKSQNRSKSRPTQRSLKITLPFGESLKDTKRRISISGNMKEVTIPGGVYSGWTKKIDKEKNVVLMVDVEDPPEDQFYKRKKFDLYKRIKLSALRAIVGVKIRIKNVYGQKIEVKIPKGTEPGELFKISDEGIKFKNKKGDMYLRVDYHIPDLNDKECEELKSIVNKKENGSRDTKFDIH